MPMPTKNRSYTRKKWWGPFLEAYAETGIITVACRRANIGRVTIYDYKRNCPEFAKLFDEAAKAALETLEDVAKQRAMTTSDTLLIFLLKCLAPDKYQDRKYLTHEGRVGLDLTNLSDDELHSILADTNET